jgi:FkbM family methyltransferase
MNKRSPDKMQTLSILRERDVPVGIVLDFGVCHGTPELMQVWPDRKHILFEPVVEFNDIISTAYRNIDHELINVAVGDEVGAVGLKVAALLPGMTISHSSMTNTSPGGDPNIRTVNKITLDSFFSGRELAAPYLLKIDIDGFELQVLRGAKETLARCSIVIVECQSTELTRRISAVEAAGFSLFDLCEPCYYDKVFWQCDAIFVRTEILADKFKQLRGSVLPGMYETFRI